MASRKLALALGLIAAATPLAAAQMEGAPAGNSETLYCMRIGPLTGSRIEQIECWTRQHWSAQGVDIDKDWAEYGVRIIG